MGNLPVLKSGRHWLFDPADLDRVFAPRPVEPRRTAIIADLERVAQRVAAQAPPLIEATRERIREILGGAR